MPDAAAWAAAGATFAAVLVAVFHDQIRAWVWRPKLKVSIRTALPDCCAVPVHNSDTGEFMADAFYFRLFIENDGRATAKNVEVYAAQLTVQRADGAWEVVEQFPPMNLTWANLPEIIALPQLTPQTGRHCDLGHVVDPGPRSSLPRWEQPATGLGGVSCFAFELMAKPNHRPHVVGPGIYRLKIEVSAENARAITSTVAIRLNPKWAKDEATMLREYVGITIE